jgi:DNA polymerase-3 subunit epsilon
MILTRSIFSGDIESTGTDAERDRIVEFGGVKMDPDGSTREYRWLVNPGIPIPAGATAVHGISNDDVASAPSFAEVAEEIDAVLTDCDFVTFNGRKFDFPMLRAEFRRANVPWRFESAAHVDACEIFHRKEPRDLSAAVRFYLGREHVGAHGAVADARAALEIMHAQLERYPDVGAMTLEELGRYSSGRRPDWATEDGKIRWDDDGYPTYAFGKHKGTRVVDELGFARWMLRNDFAEDTKSLVSRVIRGEKVRREEAP